MSGDMGRAISDGGPYEISPTSLRGITTDETTHQSSLVDKVILLCRVHRQAIARAPSHDQSIYGVESQ